MIGYPRGKWQIKAELTRDVATDAPRHVANVARCTFVKLSAANEPASNHQNDVSVGSVE